MLTYCQVLPRTARSHRYARHDNIDVHLVRAERSALPFSHLVLVQRLGWYLRRIRGLWRKHGLRTEVVQPGLTHALRGTDRTYRESRDRPVEVHLPHPWRDQHML